VVFYNTFTKHRLVVVMPYRHSKDAFGEPAWLLQCFELDVEVCVTEMALAREPYQRQGALIRGEMLDDGEWRHRYRSVGGGAEE
jgi:hypothetical protein